MRTFKRPGSVNWWFRFQHGGETYAESAGTKDRREATRIGRARREEVRAAKPSDKPQRRGVYLSELAAADMAEAAGKDLSRGYQTALEIYWRHLLVHFGPEATLASITYDTVRGYEAMRRKQMWAGRPIRGQTIREEVACLKRGETIAYRRKLISRKREKEDWPTIRGDDAHPTKRGNLVRMTDLQAVLALLPDEIAEELVFDVLTGLRREELTEVRADWLRKVGSAWTLAVPAVATKTGEPRTIGLPQQALDVFRRRLDRYGSDAPLFPPHDWRKRIRAACVKAGVPRFTYRDLRTTFATVAQAKADIASVRDAMGHDGVVTTNIYLRGRDEGVIDAGRAVAAALTRAKKGRKR